MKTEKRKFLRKEIYVVKNNFSYLFGMWNMKPKRSSQGCAEKKETIFNYLLKKLKEAQRGEEEA